uniref:Protein FAR1-RELATED SEQUENCE n=1 Tax=Cajanus cajan TaxID=3821 RepID=A0A151RF84_CAJCA|nr:Protein FAR-RED IMPAIRED RESPONSE 1 [Cajanus cajan]
MDIDQKITNVFWIDANMILDYGYFGDVVSLDTTYSTNHANSPLALLTRNIRTLGMRNTQLSKSLNSTFKSCINLNVDIIIFFKHFEQIVEEMRYNKLTCQYESLHKLTMLRYKLSPILIQMEKVYNHIVFDLFQNEFKLFLASCILERNEFHSLCQYIITRVNHERSWKVSFDHASNSITCSCRKFETFGILCSHALKVFEANDVKVIPEKYIIKKMDKKSSSGIVHDVREKEVEGNPILSITRRYKQLVFKFVRLVVDMSTFEEYHKIVDNNVDVMCKEIQELHL